MPSAREMLSALDTREIRLVMQSCWTVDSLDEPLTQGEEGGATVGDMVAGSAPDPADVVEKREQALLLEAALAKLSRRERYMVTEVVMKEQSSAGIAALEGVTPARVNQIVTGALAKMFVMLGGQRKDFYLQTQQVVRASKVERPLAQSRSAAPSHA